MGASHSSQSPKSSQHGHKRRRSSVFSRRLSLGCASMMTSSTETAHSRESSVDEKFALAQDQGRPVSTPPSKVRPLSMISTPPSQVRRLSTPPPSKARPLSTPPPPTSQAVYAIPHSINSDTLFNTAYASFLTEFPEYRSTWILDSLRRTDYARLESTGETYVDYMGGALYPESLIRVHMDFLSRSVMGNTHSVSNSSKLSLHYADEARATVLSFFHAPPEYTVIFTSNATGALKLVGESYPFTMGSSYVLGADAHNSVHGIREYATQRGAQVSYIESTPTGGFDLATAKSVLSENGPETRDTPSLFALTAQSNISNSKNPLSIIKYASSLGYHVLLDAAALAPTSVFSLKEHPVDAMAVSFYKMFGFPTGVGALIVKKSFLEKLNRPWFAGGTVDVVQVPGNIMTKASEHHEQFEDGTINYLTLPAITDGLQFLSAYLPFLPVRLSALLHYLVGGLSALRHDETGTPVVRIMSSVPKKRVKSLGEQAETGSTVSLLFLLPDGNMIPNSFIEWAASKQRISLRTGCMCNPGAAAALLGISEEMRELYPGVTLKDFETYVGRELGVVRISLGLASNFEDVWRVIRFASMMADEGVRQVLWKRWVDSKGVGAAI